MKTSISTTLGLLRSMSEVLNHYQDICDVIADTELTANDKIEKIKEINERIGAICSESLPG